MHPAKIEQFYLEPSEGKPYTQVSDHFGVSAVIEFPPFEFS